MSEERALAPLEQFGMMMTVNQAITELQRLQEFVQAVMVEGVDYGTIPGAGTKKVLFKSGAEKLNEVYAYSTTVEVIKAVEDWQAQPPFFAYTIKVTLHSRRTGDQVAEGVGSCNSQEVKYKYRSEYWDDKNEPPQAQGWEKRKARDGRVFWARRVPNEDSDLANTILKMAKKRAAVDATISATRSSGLFTQDLEDQTGEVDGTRAEHASGKSNGGPMASEAQCKFLTTLMTERFGKTIEGFELFTEWMKDQFQTPLPPKGASMKEYLAVLSKQSASKAIESLKESRPSKTDRANADEEDALATRYEE